MYAAVTQLYEMRVRPSRHLISQLRCQLPLKGKPFRKAYQAGKTMPSP